MRTTASRVEPRRCAVCEGRDVRRWWRRRKRREQAQQAALQELRDDFEARLASGDEGARESGRDWHDNDGAPWRVEVWSGAVALVLFLVLPALIAFFALVETLTD